MWIANKIRNYLIKSVKEKNPWKISFGVISFSLLFTALFGAYLHFSIWCLRQPGLFWFVILSLTTITLAFIGIAIGLALSMIDNLNMPNKYKVTKRK